jgi:Asp-tRNA(Asn)/Glu-tRNA(Gln) amidotransferase A subunit family amidase
MAHDAHGKGADLHHRRRQIPRSAARHPVGREGPARHVPTEDAAVVKRLHDAGAVLVAKLSLGALALNDIWFGGQTMNPWLPEEGSSGSSAGPGAATAAGLVGFAIGSETGGSIVGPSMRCGITGLRPTYGRVPRTGAMTRTVEDAMLVLHAISGPDSGDLASVSSRLDFDVNATVQGLRVGYFPNWMRENPATDVDRAALDVVRKLGMVPIEVAIPDWPYDSLQLILFAEGAVCSRIGHNTFKNRKVGCSTSQLWLNCSRCTPKT